MKESVIHQFWLSRYLLNRKLKLSDGRSLRVLKQGKPNINSGPDFSNSVIEIDGLEWVGCIEIHVNTSDWLKHNHQFDRAYDMIILHVVFYNDVLLKNDPPTLVLSNIIGMNELKRRVVKSNVKQLWQFKSYGQVKNLKALYLSRLKRKKIQIERDLDLTRNDWSEVLYLCLARAYGFSVNSYPFEALAKSLPLSILRRHSDSLLNIESLIFGQSGLLSHSKKSCSYSNLLKHKYRLYRLIYGLNPMSPVLWKFSQMRPLNFPTIRMAQFSTMILDYSNVANHVFEQKSIDELYLAFNKLPSKYWMNHYTFQKESKCKSKRLGRNSFENIYTNAIVPFLGVYEHYHGKKNNVEVAINRLKSIKAENNKVVRTFNQNRFFSSNALESQAFVEMSFKYNV